MSLSGIQAGPSSHTTSRDVRLLVVASGQREDVRPPRRFVEVEPARLQIVALPLVGGITDQIIQLPLPVAEIRKRQPHVALTLIERIVHRHQQPLVIRVLPGKDQEAIAGPIALPGRGAFEQAPVPLSHDRPPQRSQQLIRSFRCLIDRLPRSADQMGRDAPGAPLELTLVEEPQARREERNDCRSFMDVR